MGTKRYAPWPLAEESSVTEPQFKVAKISETQRKGHAQAVEEEYIPQPKESSSSETELDGEEPCQDNQ